MPRTMNPKAAMSHIACTWLGTVKHTPREVLAGCLAIKKNTSQPKQGWHSDWHTRQVTWHFGRPPFSEALLPGRCRNAINWMWQFGQLGACALCDPQMRRNCSKRMLHKLAWAWHTTGAWPHRVLEAGGRTSDALCCCWQCGFGGAVCSAAGLHLLQRPVELLPRCGRMPGQRFA